MRPPMFIAGISPQYCHGGEEAAAVIATQRETITIILGNILRENIELIFGGTPRVEVSPGTGREYDF